MVERIGIDDDTLDAITDALKNKKECPAKRTDDGVQYCGYGRVVECPHKGGERRFDSGDLCEVITHHVCRYRPSSE